MPTQHTCQARAGEIFRPLKFVNLFNFYLSDTRGSKETERVNFGSSLSLKTLLTESSPSRVRLVHGEQSSLRVNFFV